MDSLEEILKVVGGVIFAAIYLFGNQIFKGSGEEDAPRPPSLPRGSNTDEADDAAARQRQIQEAIRRKIMERREAAGSKPADQEPVLLQREQRKQVAERQKETLQRDPHVEVAPQAAEVDGRFSWDVSDNVYEKQMQARLEQIEATKRRAEALKRQTQAASEPQSSSTQRGTRATQGGPFSGPVREVLRNPSAARTAFVYSEVLGKPVSLRASGSGVGVD